MKEKETGAKSAIIQNLPSLPELEYVTEKEWVLVYPKGKKTKILREMIAVIGDRRPNSSEIEITPYVTFIKNDEGAARELMGIAHGYGWPQRVGLYKSRIVEDKIESVFLNEFGKDAFLSEFKKRVDFKFWRIDEKRDWYVEDGHTNFSLAIEVKRLNRHMDEKGPAMANRFKNSDYDLVVILVGRESRWRAQIARSSFARYYVFCEEDNLDNILESKVFTGVGKNLVDAGGNLREVIYSRSLLSSTAKKEKDEQLTFI